MNNKLSFTGQLFPLLFRTFHRHTFVTLYVPRFLIPITKKKRLWFNVILTNLFPTALSLLTKAFISLTVGRWVYQDAASYKLIYLRTPRIGPRPRALNPFKSYPPMGAVFTHCTRRPLTPRPRFLQNRNIIGTPLPFLLSRRHYFASRPSSFGGTTRNSS